MCGSATSSKYLVWCRTITGISSAALLQGSTSIIEFIVPASNDNNSLIDYVKFVESAYAFSLAIGPVLAGVIVDRWDWRWCFWINGITGTCLFILVAVSFRRCSIHEVQCKGSIFAKLRSLDYLGPISSSGALLCLLLALHWAGLEHAWTSVTTLGLLFAFVFLSILLIFVEWIQEDRAMLPPMTLRREVLWSSLFLFCAYGTSAMVSCDFSRLQGKLLTCDRYPFTFPSIFKLARAHPPWSVVFEIYHWYCHRLLQLSSLLVHLSMADIA